MKLLTLNTHSLIEENYDEKIEILCKAILKHTPNIIALQEVMQPYKADEAVLTEEIKTAGEIPIKEGNFALNVLKRLKKDKANYFLAYCGIKKAYEIYDEGVAILSSERIREVEIGKLSSFSKYDNWKTRISLGACVGENWFYSLHFNWWDDKLSPFESEWENLLKSTINKKNVWLLGDFNITPDSEGYKLVINSFYDTYELADEIDNGITVPGVIDGWENRKDGKRIDYIFSKKEFLIKSSKVIFNGKNERKISDHFGVLVER